MTNRLTPRLKTVRPSEIDWISIDIGLWPGERGGKHLTMMVYHQGIPGRWRPVAGRLDAWERAGAYMRDLWSKYACEPCSGDGCTACGNVGWRDFVRWCDGGELRDKDNFAVFPQS